MKKTAFLFALSLCFANILLSQVTIGSHLPPIEGALLDMRQGTDGLSTKGLILPRVEITDTENLFPMFKDDDDYKNNVIQKKENEDKAHQGLTVYNTHIDYCKEIYPGIRVWDGSKWTAIGPPIFPAEVSTITDNRDPNNKVVYEIGKFGNAGWWMLRNLRAEKWPDGTDNSIVFRKKDEDPLNEDRTFYYPLFDSYTSTYKEDPVKYGYAYSWYAATGITNAELESGLDLRTAKVQGICPDGWHLPNFTEWLELRDELILNPCKYSLSDIGINSAYNITAPDSESLQGKSRPIEQGGFYAYMLSMRGDRSYFWFSGGPTPEDTTGPGYYKFPNGTYYLITAALDKNTPQMARTAYDFRGQIPIRCKKDTD